MMEIPFSTKAFPPAKLDSIPQTSQSLSRQKYANRANSTSLLADNIHFSLISLKEKNVLIDLIFESINQLVSGEDHNFVPFDDPKNYFQTSNNNIFADYFLERIWDQLLVFESHSPNRGDFQLLAMHPQPDSGTVLVLYRAKNVGVILHLLN